MRVRRNIECVLALHGRADAVPGCDLEAGMNENTQREIAFARAMQASFQHRAVAFSLDSFYDGDEAARAAHIQSYTELAASQKLRADKLEAGLMPYGPEREAAYDDIAAREVQS